jgi:hypothetical protein
MRRVFAAVGTAALATAGLGLHAAPTIAVTPTVSANLLDTATSSLETGIGTWTAPNGRLALATRAVHGGHYALSLSAKQAGDYYVESGRLSVVPGQQYTATAFTSTAASSAVVQAALFFRTASGASAGAVFGQGTTATTTWSKTREVVALAPANAATVSYAVVFYDVKANDSRYVDDTIVQTTVRPRSADLVGPFTTAGNKILDANGVPVTFRGLARTGFEVYQWPNNFSEYEVDRAKTWGANIVRVPLGSHYWLDDSSTADPTYKAKIDAVVKWITDRGMVALLDLHWHTIGAGSTPGQHFMADAAGSIRFWQELGARYKSNPLVAFDLYNEPHDISDQVWRDGGTVTEGSFTYEAAGMQDMVDAVRSTGATNLVFASGNNWSNNFPATASLSGDNIVYGVHVYRCPTAAPPNCGGAVNPYDPSPILNGWVTPSKSVPVVITEFGWPDFRDGIYHENVINYAEAHGWGWVTWGWDGTANQYQFNLLVDVGPGATYNPSPSGMPVLKGLALNT